MQLSFITGNLEDKMVLIIGQAPPEKQYSVPFKGTRLYNWFGTIGLDESFISKKIEFDALVGSFPGKSTKGHLIPKENEIKLYIPSLLDKINRSNISIIIPVGKLAIEYVLNKKPDLKADIGKSFFQPPFGIHHKSLVIIPLPHPSGASSWIFDADNKILLEEALKLIKLALQN